jgi:hypothetical protein
MITKIMSQGKSGAIPLNIVCRTYQPSPVASHSKINISSISQLLRPELTMCNQVSDKLMNTCFRKGKM